MNTGSGKISAEASGAKQLQQIIKRRRTSVIMIIAAFLVLLVLFNVGNFIFLNQMSEQLETELGQRLLSVAKLSATIVENEFPESFSSEEADRLTLSVIQGRLREIRQQHQLEGLFIINREYNTVVDSYQGLEFAITRTYLQEDYPFIEQAWQGIASSSPIHSIEKQKFKSAYAPIRNLSGMVIGVLVAEANAYFFILLDRYFNTFFLTATVSAGVFVLFTAFLIYALRLLIRTQENLRDTERLAMMGQMSAVLAHEIRNPLGIIRGTADVLRSRYQNPKKPEPLFEYIPDEVNRLNKLVNNFLILSRKANLNLRKQDLNQLIESTLAKLKLVDSRENVSVDFRASQLPAFYFDPDAIQQVIMNLVRNACQAVDSTGSVILTTGEYEKKKKRFAQIRVSDTGCGIEGDPEAVFEPFFTTKSSGSGLGMAVSKKIVENHGGWIEIESVKGKGTTVSFSLPIRENLEDH